MEISGRSWPVPFGIRYKFPPPPTRQSPAQLEYGLLYRRNQSISEASAVDLSSKCPGGHTWERMWASMVNFVDGPASLDFASGRSLA